ncbi:MAG: LysR family transcriptional regulator [Mesorhizobium sp. SCN 65-12]|nr:MAG: LysR family transcriptional regulator [Mesorhizobium sp. SCN 65-12]
MRYPDLEIDLLRAFTTVAETGSFTAAADVVGRSQSAVSQKIIRLEELLGRPLFNRTSRSLVLTGEGERLLSAARRMLEFNDMAVRTLVEPADVERLRIGISEDFVPHHLPALLGKFATLCPDVRLELMTGLSCNLLAAYDEDRLDVVIAKKDGRAQRGRVIWREPLVWIASAGYDHETAEPVPLVLLPTPCTYRGVAIRALDSVRRDWRVACTANSLVGARAAVAGGFGVTVLGRSFVQDGLRIIPPSDLWPVLPMTEIVVIGEETVEARVVHPLLSFLTETLSRGQGARALGGPSD